MQATRPTRHALISTTIIFSTIVFLGSFHDINDAIGFASLFVGLPWIIFYFLEWLGGDLARSFKEEIDRERAEKDLPPLF